jgi:hypothetical protein
MLSRIADLEAGIAMGNFIQAPVPSSSVAEQAGKYVTDAKPSKPVRKAVYDDDDDEMFRDDAPKASRASTTEAKPTSRATVTDNTKSAQKTRVLKPFRSRAEVLEKMDAASGMHSSFFKSAKWYTDEDGRFVLKFANQFGIDNMKLFDGEDFFIRIVSRVLGRNLTKNDVICECEEAGSKSDSVIDQILEAADE